MRKAICSIVFLFLLLLLFNSPFFSQEKNMTQIIKQKDQSYLLKFANLELTVEPKTGGRISSLKLGNREFLVTKGTSPFSYGSTFWPSPQSVWNWPPPSTLDRASYEVIDSTNKITLKSKKDDALGWQFKKEISFSEKDTSIQILYTIINTSDKDNKVAPWEITRMFKGGLVFFPKGLTAPKAKSFDAIPYSEENKVLWYKIKKDEKLNNHLLSVSDGADGWLAYAFDDYIFIKSFDDVLPENQAPNEGEIPIYIDSKSQNVEIEVQGPYTNVKQGKEFSWKMKWFVREMPDNLKPESGNIKLIEFVNSIIH
jgi:hypothetical protein